MKTSNKQDHNIKNIPESAREIEDQVARPKSRLKKTVVTSAVSLALLGAGQIPMHALLGGAEPSIQAQTPASNSDDRALKEYFKKDFNYVDAKILAAYWGGNVGDAKIRMGGKLLNLSSDEAMSFIREARGLALERSTVDAGRGRGFMDFHISFGDMGYVYEDVEALSAYWGQNIDTTKLMLDTMLVSGKNKDIKAALKNAKR